MEIIDVVRPPNTVSTPNIANGNICSNPTKAQMNGAVNNHIRAHTTHENIQIFRFSNGNNSPVHVNSIDCDVDIAILQTEPVTIK